MNNSPVIVFHPHNCQCSMCNTVPGVMFTPTKEAARVFKDIEGFTHYKMPKREQRTGDEPV